MKSHFKLFKKMYFNSFILFTETFSSKYKFFVFLKSDQIRYVGFKYATYTNGHILIIYAFLIVNYSVRKFEIVLKKKPDTQWRFASSESDLMLIFDFWRCYRCSVGSLTLFFFGLKKINHTKSLLEPNNCLM